MKVCLIGYYDEGQYGLRCLEATLEEAGHEVDLVFMKGYFSLFIPPTEREYELMTGLVSDLKPDLIGITVRSSFIWLVKEITLRLRHIGAPILWGGFHTTVAPEYAIKRPDMILRGEADRTLPMLADALSSGGDLSKIPGLWYKEGNDIHKNALGPAVEDLDSLPLPIFRDEHRWFIEGNKLFALDPVLTGKIRYYATMASRGCPQKCTYCANASLVKLYGNNARLIRMRNPLKVVEEVIAFKENYGRPDLVVFMDEVFGYKPTWVNEFCELWKKKLNTSFNAEIHPSLVNEDLIATLKDAGLEFLNMGIQSGSERIRREIYHRPTSNDQIIKAAKIIEKHDINYRVEFIFDSPYDEAEDLKETLHLLLELPRPFVTVFYRLTHFPGTPLTERCLDEGIITRDQVPGYNEDVTSTWVVIVDLEDGRTDDYHFYMCLILLADFRYYFGDSYESEARPNFYPRFLIRWFEKQAWLRHDPKLMLKITDKMGKFAHWSYYWTSYIPKRLSSKILTTIRLLLKGDTKSLKAGFAELAMSIRLQFGMGPKSTSQEALLPKQKK